MTRGAGGGGFGPGTHRARACRSWPCSPTWWTRDTTHSCGNHPLVFPLVKMGSKPLSPERVPISAVVARWIASASVSPLGWEQRAQVSSHASRHHQTRSLAAEPGENVCHGTGLFRKRISPWGDRTCRGDGVSAESSPAISSRVHRDASDTFTCPCRSTRNQEDHGRRSAEPGGRDRPPVIHHSDPRLFLWYALARFSGLSDFRSLSSR